jgi:hypothetical protein
MADPEVLMDYPAVTQAAANFESSGEAFQMLIGPLAAVGQRLVGQEFVGLTGNSAAQTLQAIEAQLKVLVQRCAEMSSDIRTSIQNYQAGDTEGANQYKS